MANTTAEMSVEAARPAEDDIEFSAAIPIEPPKLKSRGKLLQNLHRISSSPSLQIGRKRATSNPYTARNTISCVSLASGNHAMNYDTSPPSANFSSGTSTPGLELPFVDGRLATRRVELTSPGYSAPTSPLPLGSSLARGLWPFPELADDYFSLPGNAPPRRRRRANFDFWGEMPHEIKLAIFAYLMPKELIRSSVVSKSFQKICLDGQLWTCFDATEFYKDIPAESLTKILVAAGPFVKDLNLRGCIQVEHHKAAEVVVKACRNLINATLEGCKNFQKTTLHTLLKSNERLAHLNLTGITAVTNATCKIIAQSCPQLEVLNVSWCTHMDVRGITEVLLGCSRLKELRAGEVRGFNNLDFAQTIFETNNLERLVMSGCGQLNDEAFRTMIVGTDPEIDILTDTPIVPSRRFRHLDVSRCKQLTSASISALAHLVPSLQGLNLAGCHRVDDAGLSPVLATTPNLTHLDLEDLAQLTDDFLSKDLAKSPCAKKLRHLSISSCENLGDVGMIAIMRACTSLQNIDMDNTRISDLVLLEAVGMVRRRSTPKSISNSRPKIGLNMVIYDCQNVTWTGVREILAKNSELTSTIGGGFYPQEIIQLKCFYGWQQTVAQHQKRVLDCNFDGAKKLERRWAEYQMLSEEAGAGGLGGRRRRRRLREAQMLHADEEGGEGSMGIGAGGIGRRRRARSSGCSIM